MIALAERLDPHEVAALDRRDFQVVASLHLPKGQRLKLLPEDCYRDVSATRHLCSYRLHGGLFSHWQILVLSCGNNFLAAACVTPLRAGGPYERQCAARLLLVARRTRG